MGDQLDRKATEAEERLKRLYPGNRGRTVRPGREVFNPADRGAALDNIRNELIDLLRGVVEHSPGRAAALSGFAAGKTGTSQDYRDAWSSASTIGAGPCAKLKTISEGNKNNAIRMIDCAREAHCEDGMTV
jgi:hypothetical protein